MRRTILVGCLLLTATAEAAEQRLDIRDCPLDTVVFVDPWAGGMFSVARVGTEYRWLCDEGKVMPDPSCVGPYGNLVLEGTYRKYQNEPTEPMTATYTIENAVPCCGWSVEEGAANDSRSGFTWLGPTGMPKLRDMQWLSIEAPDGTFMNPLYAAACTLR